MAAIGKLFLLYLDLYGNMYIILANQSHGKKKNYTERSRLWFFKNDPNCQYLTISQLHTKQDIFVWSMVTYTIKKYSQHKRNTTIKLRLNKYELKFAILTWTSLTCYKLAWWWWNWRLNRYGIRHNFEKFSTWFLTTSFSFNFVMD